MIIKSCPLCGGQLNKEFFGHPRFYALLAEEAELHSTKNYQYASSEFPLGNFYRTGILTQKLFKDDIDNSVAIALCYMAKQIDGVYDIIGEGKVGTIESVKDKLKDISVYCKIIEILIEEIDDNGNKDGKNIGDKAV